MRILCISGCYDRWSETFLRRDLQALSKLGYEVAVWSCETSLRMARWCDARARPLPPIIESSGGCSLHGAKALLKAGWAQMLRIPDLMRMRSLLPFHPDVVWALHGSLPAVMAAALAQSMKVPLCVSFHARDVWVPYPPARRVLCCARSVFMCNDAALCELQRQVPHVSDRMRRLNHGLPSACFASEPRPESTPVVVAAGRFVEKKGFSCLLRAWSSVLRELPQAALRLIGGGAEDRAYARLRNELGLTSKQVEIHPAMTPESLAAAIRAAHLVVVPSRVASDGDRDGIPNILLEGMAAGVPVVGTRVGGIPEVLLDGVTGRLVPPDDPSLLAEAIVRQIRNPASSREMADAARVRVQCAFAQEQTLPLLEQALTECVESSESI